MKKYLVKHPRIAWIILITLIPLWAGTLYLVSNDISNLWSASCVVITIVISAIGWILHT